MPIKEQHSDDQREATLAGLVAVAWSRFSMHALSFKEKHGKDPSEAQRRGMAVEAFEFLVNFIPAKNSYRADVKRYFRDEVPRLMKSADPKKTRAK